MEKLVLVNKKDEVVGFGDKEKCHLGKGTLHRAFTILIFDDTKGVLITKRNKSKKLWPLFWETSCSSHPREDETYEKAGERRLKEELGLNLPLKLVNKFQYQAPYQNIGSENEVCALLIGKYNRQEIKSNPDEVSEWQWIEIKKLKKDINKNPENYAPWLKIGLEKLERYEKKFKSLL